MKIVSIEVAKAIKEAGYPQEGKHGYRDGESSLVCYPREGLEFYVAPTYIEVWLWLWREKNIRIEIIDSKITTQCYATINDEKDTTLFNSPEEAIVAAIKFLVNNDLIK